jgi:putative membrane protein
MKTMALYNAVFGIAACALISCGSVGDKDKPAPPKVDSTATTQPNMEADHNFAWTAAEGGMLEVMLGQLAVSNGASKNIKALGQMMIDDHSKANEELKMLAQKKNIRLPDQLGEEAQMKYDKLAALKGKAFDKAYADAMVTDHEKDIALFREEANTGNDPDLKQWAAGKLPTLEHHLSMSMDAKVPAE